MLRPGSKLESIGVEADGLAARYQAKANDKNASLFAKAEAHLEGERWTEALQAAQDAVAAYRSSGDADGLADSLRIAVGVQRQRRELKEAADAARSELAQFAAKGDQRAQACMMLALAELANSGLEMAADEEASQLLSKAVALFKSANDERMAANALLVLSGVHLVQGSQGKGKASFEDAQACAEEALAITQKLQDRHGSGKAYHALALAGVYRGHTGNGITYAKQALEVWRSAQNKKLEAFEQHCLSMWHLANRTFDEAFVAAGEAEKLFEELQKVKNEDEGGYVSAVKAQRSQALLEKGDVSAALEAANANLQEAKKVNDKAAEASALQTLCSCEEATGKIKEALEHAKSAQDALSGVPDSQLWEAAVLQKVASFHMLQAEIEEAVKAATKAVELCKEAQDKREQAKTMCFLSDIQVASGELEQALDLTSEARDIFADIGDVQGEASACLSKAAVQAARNESRKAAAAAKTAWELYQEVGDERGEADALLTMCRLAFDRNDFQIALSFATKGLELVKALGEPTAELTHVLAAAQAAFGHALYEVGQPPAMQKPGDEWNQALTLASEAFEKAKIIESEKYDKFVLSAAHAHVQVLTGRREFPEALESLRVALDICERDDLKNEKAQLQLLSAQIHASQKQKSEALQAVNAAIDMFEDMEDELGLDVAEDFKDEILGRRQRAGDSDSSSGSGSDSDSSDEDSSEEESEEEEEEVVVQGDAGPPVYNGPSKEEIVQTVKQSAIDMIGSDSLAGDEALMDAGLDSLAAVEYGGILGKTFKGVDLPGTLMFDFPNANAIAGFLHDTMQSSDAYLTKPAALTTTVVKKKKEKAKKKKKKKRKDSSSEEESEEEEEVVEEGEAGPPVYSGPSQDEITQTVKQAALDMIGADSLAGDEALMDAGLDSLAAVEYGGIIAKTFKGVDLPGTLMFDFPNVKQIGGYLYESMQSNDAYLTKPAAITTKVVKKKKEKAKKKKKKRKDSSSEEESEEEEEVVEEGEAGPPVYNGPSQDEITQTVKQAALDMIGADSLAGDEALMDAGLDSLAAVEYGGIIAKTFKGVDLPGTLMFDFPNVKQIGGYLFENMQSNDAYLTKPAAITTKIVKKKKEKAKKKKKKKRKDSSSEDESEEEEEVVEEEGDAGPPVYNGPSKDEIVQTVKQSAIDMIGSDSLAGDEALMDAGLDSLAAVEYGGILGKTFKGVDLPGTLMFDFPNANAIAGFLHESMQSSDAYLTKPTPALKTRTVKKAKDKKKKKKKKRKDESESEEEDEGEEEEEMVEAGEPVYTGPSSAEVLETVKKAALDMIGADSLAGDEALMDAGLDSLAAVEYGGILSKTFQGVNMPGTLMFDHPSARQIAGFLFENMQSIDGYFTKPAATSRPKAIKAKKEKPKKKDKKKKKKKRRDEEEEDEDEDEAEEEAPKQAAIKTYTGPTLQEVLDTVKGSAIDMIGADSLASDEALMDAGLDSLAAVEYGGILSKTFQGVTMPGTMMFDFPNIKLISGFIYGEMRTSQGFPVDM